ncbi:hypothetical protein FRC10_005620 [Ceratobasidium sp. 414]|nr:hypothetical protein FRC10_005620 [Ceratobasidium sp. 414]
MENVFPAPSLDLRWTVVRMASVGYCPSVIETCTAIPQPVIHQILTMHQMTGQVAQQQPMGLPPPMYYYPAPQPWYGGHPPLMMAPPHFAVGAAPAPQMGVNQFAPIIHPLPVARQNVPITRQPAKIPQATITEVPEEAPRSRIPIPPPQPPAPPRPRTPAPPPAIYQPPTPPQPSVAPRSSAPSKHATGLKYATAQKPYLTSKPTGGKKPGAILKPIKSSNSIEAPKSVAPPSLALGRKKVIEWRKIIPSAILVDLAPLAPAVKSEPKDPVPDEKTGNSGKISGYDIEHLRHYLSDHPAAEFRELCDELLERSVSVSPFQLFRAFRQHRVKKRMSHWLVDAHNWSESQDEHWIKGDRVAREQFAFKVGEFPYHELMFVAQFPWDVTYRRVIPSRKRQGWAQIQRFMISFALSSNGIEIINVSDRLGILGYEDVIDYTMQRTGRSVFILNKRQMEDKDSLDNALRVCGKQHFFLPPSSSDYNPTKLAKAWIKEEIEKREGELAAAIDVSAARGIVEDAVKSISGGQARGWFKECNYM